MGIGIYPTSGFVHIDFRAPGEPSFQGDAIAALHVVEGVG